MRPQNAAILAPEWPGWRQPGAGLREDVFSSTGFRIRGSHGHASRQLAGWAEDVVASLFFTFFPADCRICGSPLVRVSRLPVCADCVAGLHPLKGTFCAVCGEALLSPLFRDRGEALCGLCQRAHPPFGKAVAYGSYDTGLRDQIHLLKYQQIRPAAKVLGRLWSEAIRNIEAMIPDGIIAVVPVPLHRRKQKQRGFNQSELIGQSALRELAKPERFELCAGTLIRCHETASQIGLTRHQRRENMRGAFVVSNSHQIVGRQVLLVDDVFTTGTTVSECSRVLLRAGAAGVWVVTVARTLKTADILAMPERVSEERKEGDAVVARA